jgi:heat shock protein HtpX
MALTMFLLAAVYIVFIGVLSLYANFGTVVVFAGIFLLVQYFFSDRLALRSMGAREVDEDEYPDLHRMVGRLSQQADLPKPTVAVADTSTPNAFATGRSKKTATVCVTTGLMRSLNEDELEGVVAHELAHVKNRDVMVMTIASFLATIAMFIIRWGWLFGGGRDRQGGGPQILVAIAASVAVWIISFLLIRALSRYREFAADRGGAAITGKPSALASALMTIDQRMDKVPDRDMREQSEMNAFFIVPLDKGMIAKLFRTHPSTERRIERLRDLERDLETA